MCVHDNTHMCTPTYTTHTQCTHTQCTHTQCTHTHTHTQCMNTCTYTHTSSSTTYRFSFHWYMCMHECLHASVLLIWERNKRSGILEGKLFTDSCSRLTSFLFTSNCLVPNRTHHAVLLLETLCTDDQLMHFCAIHCWSTGPSQVCLVTVKCHTAWYALVWLVTVKCHIAWYTAWYPLAELVLSPITNILQHFDF